MRVFYKNNIKAELPDVDKQMLKALQSRARILLQNNNEEIKTHIILPTGRTIFVLILDLEAA